MLAPHIQQSNRSAHTRPQQWLYARLPACERQPSCKVSKGKRQPECRQDRTKCGMDHSFNTTIDVTSNLPPLCAKSMALLTEQLNSNSLSPVLIPVDAWTPTANNTALQQYYIKRKHSRTSMYDCTTTLCILDQIRITNSDLSLRVIGHLQRALLKARSSLSQAAKASTSERIRQIPQHFEYVPVNHHFSLTYNRARPPRLRIAFTHLCTNIQRRRTGCT